MRKNETWSTPLLDVVWIGATSARSRFLHHHRGRCSGVPQPSFDSSSLLCKPHQEVAPAVLEVAGSFLPPTPPRAPPSFQGRSYDPLPLQGVWWVLLLGFQLYCPCLLLPRWSRSSTPPPPPPPTPPFRCGRGLGTWISLSSPCTILTLNSAGCRCSAFELSKFDAVDD